MKKQKLNKAMTKEILADRTFTGGHDKITIKERIRLHDEGRKKRKQDGNKKEALMLPKNLMAIRRKPCICGSGKRFKNCCQNKVM